jgi:NTE family protein
MATRALVLGGGGPVGIAWESGLIAGLAQAGVDLGQADFTLGTSAGAFVGARLAMGAPAAKLADPIFADVVRPLSRAARPPDLTNVMRLMVQAQEAERDPTEVFAEIGELALAAETMSEDEFIESFGRWFSSLPPDAWPERGFACTAVDAQSGAFRLWTRHAGVGVTRAVAASCAIPGVYPPISALGRRWMDGGVRSSTNADLAAGHDLVVILAIRLDDWTPGGALARVFARLEHEVRALEEAGAAVVTLLPDEASRAAMGGNLMEFRKRPDAARAGLAQGAAEAAALMRLWG